jgi:hypothetical protein
MNRIEEIKNSLSGLKLAVGEDRAKVRADLIVEDIEYLLAKLELAHETLNQLHLSCPPPAKTNFDTAEEKDEYCNAIERTTEVLQNLLLGDEKSPLRS